MHNPASPELRRTCPTCNRPVRPGYKFCETCGTQVVELSTCSSCGTQYIDPVNYCELCGAPVNPGIEPEPDDVPEENTGRDKDRISEPDAEEIPETDTDQSPADNRKIIIPFKAKTLHLEEKKIQEPDTDELLKQFGSEYDDNETLGSYHKPKSVTVDDAMLLSPGKRAEPAKSRANTAKIYGGAFVLVAIIAAVYFIGVPMLWNGGAGTHGNQSAANMTPVMTPVGIVRTVMVTTPIPASRALIPLPTQQIPSGQKIYFQVRKDPVTAKISVIFAGSAGEGSIKSADITVTHPDGSVSTGIIQPLKGINEITLDGSEESDRLEIMAQMSSGGTYRVYDALVPLI